VLVHNSSHGISVNAPTRAAVVMLNNMLSANNLGMGLSLTGAAGTMRVGGSVVSGNFAGGVTANIGSYKNNQINGNNGGEPALTQVGFD
jgi:hypothetical protein